MLLSSLVSLARNKLGLSTTCLFSVLAVADGSWHFLCVHGLPQFPATLLNSMADWYQGRVRGEWVRKIKTGFTCLWHRSCERRWMVILQLFFTMQQQWQWRHGWATVLSKTDDDISEMFPSAAEWPKRRTDRRTLTIKLSRAHSYYDDRHGQGGSLWRKHRRGVNSCSMTQKHIMFITCSDVHGLNALVCIQKEFIFLRFFFQRV